MLEYLQEEIKFNYHTIARSYSELTNKELSEELEFKEVELGLKGGN